MKNPFKSMTLEQMTKGGIIAGIVGVVITTVGDIVSRVRHDRREDKLYATLTIKADEVSTNLFSHVDLLNEVHDTEEEA